MVVSVDESNFVDFVESGLAGKRFGESGLTEERHPLFFGRPLDVGGRPLLEDHLADPVRHVEQLGDRRPSTVSRTVAVDAALSFIEGEVRVARGVQAGVLELLARRLDGLFATVADQTYKPLRENTVEGRDEIVRLDLHVEEPPDDVDNVVGVNRREHEVTRQGRLDRDLCRLLVPDLADHDLVGVVTQDRAKTAGKGQPLLFIDRDLRDPRQLILDWILDRDDLVFFVLDFGKRCVQGGRLTGSGGPRHEHHPIRLLDKPSQPQQVLGLEPANIEAQLGELAVGRFLVENSDDAVFAVDTRHDRLDVVFGL